ncbi:MAG: hypothetical protein ABFS12_16070 [Bacteroidota bacterium]
MSSEEIKTLINKYFDNELNKNEEVFLFSQLSQDEEARTYFKNINLIKEGIHSTLDNIPNELEENILNSTIAKREKSKLFQFNIPTVIGYTFSVVLLIISIFMYSQSIEYKKDIEMSIQQINHQNKMIEMLFHSLPETEVKATFANDIIVKPTI